MKNDDIHIYYRSQQVILEPSMSEEPVRRTLLQAPTPPPVKPPIVYNESGRTCIMLWAQSLNISLSATGSDWIDLATQEPSVTGQCGITNSR